MVRAQASPRQTHRIRLAWYPTLLGETDQIEGKHVKLLCAEFSDSKSARRNFLARELVFRKKQP